MKIVETIRLGDQVGLDDIANKSLKNQEAQPECWRQDHWLLRGDGSPPVLLVSDCFMQDRPGQSGDSATEVQGCDLYFRNFNVGKATCRIREVWIKLDTLKPYRMIESDGLEVDGYFGYVPNPVTSRAIRLPLGKGVIGSPLIEMDGPATLDKETVLPKVATSVPTSAENAGEPPCVLSGACRVHRTWNLPKCAGEKIIETRSTLGPMEQDGYGEECVSRFYWLVRGAGKSAIHLATDCEAQTGAADTGPATIRIENCNLLFKYTELQWDWECITREVGINLSTMRVFLEIERNGTFMKDDCKTQNSRRKSIHLRRGRGIPGDPWIHLDEIKKAQDKSTVKNQ